MILENSLLLDKGSVKSSCLDDEEIIDLGKQTFYIPTYYLYNSVETDSTVEARPDLLSEKLYGTDMYGDIIAKLNGWSNPFEMPADEVIIIPQVNEVSRFFYKGKDPMDEDSMVKPKPKKKNEKRKASDAVIGDTRFRIDSEKKIVIY